MPGDDYDLIVIGGGAAGLAAARTGVAASARTLLVAQGEPGGECTFTGCVPSKTLIEAAARGATGAAAMAAVRRTVSSIARAEAVGLRATPGIEVLRGRAEICPPVPPAAGAGGRAPLARVRVDGRALLARAVVLATGSRPAVPSIPGLAGVPFLTNETVFDLAEIPPRLAVVGGGAVGCELAQAFRRLGSDVTLVEAAPRLLPAADASASAVLARAVTGEGVAVLTGSTVRRVEQPADEPAAVALELPGRTVTADRLLIATGRRPVTEHLGLAAAGIRLDRRGAIAVDRHLATTAPGIYAAGDCTGLMPFTHAAYLMGRLAARNALRRRGTPPARFGTAAIPWVVFTDPEVGQVGLTEAQAVRVRGARVASVPMREVDRAVTAGRTEGFVTLIAGPRLPTGNLGGGRLLGATIVAARAGEMIDEVALAMRAGMFAGRLAQATHAYPTWTLAIQQAAAQFFGGYGGRTARSPRAGIRR